MSESDLPPLLVLDHQVDDRELLKLVLRGAWGEVIVEEAPNAAALARQMTVGTFGLVVTESNLPWIKGEDVVRLVRDLRPGVPVIVLTARPLSEVATELIHLAPDAVVPKTSAGWTDLPRVIRRLLDDARRRARIGHGAGLGGAAGATSDAEEMAYVVSHDLRKPLTQVVRTLDLLASDGTAAAAKNGDLLSLARRGAHRLETLVDGVEAYARISSEPVRERVELESLLGRVLQRLADERAASKAEVTHDALPAVLGSPPQLEQLFVNLLGNALKFRGDRPARVHVGAERRDTAWHLTVRDEGIGIDPRDAERIFALFQRLHTEDEYPGSGIGLALCRRIVERHGGRIWVDSRPGAGATFHVTLPQASEPET